METVSKEKVKVTESQIWLSLRMGTLSQKSQKFQLRMPIYSRCDLKPWLCRKMRQSTLGNEVAADRPARVAPHRPAVGEGSAWAARSPGDPLPQLWAPWGDHEATHPGRSQGDCDQDFPRRLSRLRGKATSGQEKITRYRSSSRFCRL